jgi:succinate-semialdehyde dehydrogenase
MSHFRKSGSMNSSNNKAHSSMSAGATTVNPATGQFFAWHPHQTADEVSTLLEGAVDAHKEWRAVPLEERSAILKRVGAILRERRDILARTITSEMGKPISQARAEVDKCAAACDWYAKNGPSLLADEQTTVADGGANISFLPLGVVLGIMPWNYPAWQAFRAILPIVLAGNGFLLKHAPNCTTTAFDLIRIIESAGAPKYLVSVLNVAQSEIQAVIQDSRIAAVTITGSIRAGSAVASQAGQSIKKSVLELGGSDPFIVLADADLDQAVAAAVAARFQNTGQSCIAAKRIIVEEPIRRDFTSRFVESVRGLELGDPLLDKTYIGPMARTDLRAELADQLTRSVAQGAAVLLDGGPLAGSDGTAFFRPAILGNVEPGMAAFDEETFGPLAAIIAAKDVEQAVLLANRSEFGLSAALWTTNIAQAKAVARRLETGGVFINGYSASDPRVPIGGVKKSGYGRELSYFGIREFTNAQVVWVDRR